MHGEKGRWGHSKRHGLFPRFRGQIPMSSHDTRSPTRSLMTVSTLLSFASFDMLMGKRSSALVVMHSRTCRMGETG